MSTMLAEDYVLGRDMLGSIRLDAQHAIWTIHNGWTMNPRIPITSDMKIAEIGTGTSLWLLDLATKLPETVTLDGFDISDSQFPPSSLLPPNVTLRTLNALDTVPEHLVGKYDVVHMRMWGLILSPARIPQLLGHVNSLLKPGGYVQWEDADVGLTKTLGEEAETLLSMAHKACIVNGIQFGWTENVEESAGKAGLKVLEHYHGPISKALVPLVTRTYLGAVNELFLSNARRDDTGLPSSQWCRQQVATLMEKFSKGEALFHWTALTLLAQKPLSG